MLIWAPFAVALSPPVDTEAKLCGLNVQVAPQPSAVEWEQIRKTLEQRLESCLNSSDYFALYGASLLYTGRLSYSIEMLERALLLNPNNGSARIDYAEALYRNGELFSAIELNKQLLLMDAVPENVVDFLDQRGQEWESSRYNWISSFTYLYGYSNNLNNATFVEDIKIRLSGREYLIQLEEESRALNGRYQYVGLDTRYETVNESGIHQVLFGLKSRSSYFNESDTLALSVDFSADKALRTYHARWGGGVEHLNYGGAPLHTSVDVNASLYMLRYSWTPYIKTSANYTVYHSIGSADEVSLAVTPGVAMSTEYGSFGAELQFAYDITLGDRPGDQQRKLEAGVFWSREIGEARLSARLEYGFRGDREGYSFLLDDNEVRTLKSSSASLMYALPFGKDKELYARYYFRKQHSNIDLFDTDTKNIDVGFRIGF